MILINWIFDLYLEKTLTQGAFLLILPLKYNLDLPGTLWESGKKRKRKEMRDKGRKKREECKRKRQGKKEEEKNKGVSIEMKAKRKQF